MSTLQTTNLKHPDSSTNNIRFDSSGRVGFGGADTPVGVVTIYDSTNAYLYFQNSASGTSAGDGFSVLHHSSRDTFIANRDDGDIAIEAGGAEALRIKSDRRVAVGTSAPPNTADFTVRAPNPELSLYASANFSSFLMMGDTDDYDNGNIEYDNHDPNKFMKFVTNGAERLRIRKDGVIKHTGLAGGGGDNKLAQYVVPSHNTNEEDVLVFQAENEGSFNQISFGGGTSSFNAATALRFLPASAVDTTTGTERLRVNGDGLDVSGNQVSNVVAMAALDVDCRAGNYFTKTINGNSTFTFSNVPSSRSFAFVLELTHTSGTVTWPSSVKFPDDTAPTLTTGKTHLFIFETNDGGTRFRGAALVDYVN